MGTSALKEVSVSNGAEMHKTKRDCEYTVDEALSVIGFGKVQLAMTVTSALCMMVVINETMGSVEKITSSSDLEKTLISA